MRASSTGAFEQNSNGQDTEGGIILLDASASGVDDGSV